MKYKCVAEAYPLGSYLDEEMKARGWLVRDVANRCSIGADRICTILEDADAFVMMKEAEQLGYAFDVSPGTLLNLQLGYRRFKTACNK